MDVRRIREAFHDARGVRLTSQPLAYARCLAFGLAVALPLAGPSASPRSGALTIAATTVATGAPTDAPSGTPTIRTAWVWPVAAPHPIARPFIAPATPYASGHRGIDIRTRSPEVFAPESGIVSFAGMIAGRPVLAIRHPGGLVSSFEPVNSVLAAGTAVNRGQLVGSLLTGHCADLCVHFGVRRAGEYVSPLNYLGSVPRAILLPTR